MVFTRAAFSGSVPFFFFSLKIRQSRILTRRIRKHLPWPLNWQRRWMRTSCSPRTRMQTVWVFMRKTTSQLPHCKGQLWCRTQAFKNIGLYAIGIQTKCCFFCKLEDRYFDEETKKELLDIAGDEKEIEDRFYRELEFGTGGRPPASFHIPVCNPSLLFLLSDLFTIDKLFNKYIIIFFIYNFL